MDTKTIKAAIIGGVIAVLLTAGVGGAAWFALQHGGKALSLAAEVNPFRGEYHDIDPKRHDWLRLVKKCQHIGLTRYAEDGSVECQPHPVKLNYEYEVEQARLNTRKDAVREADKAAFNRAKQGCRDLNGGYPGGPCHADLYNERTLCYYLRDDRKVDRCLSDLYGGGYFIDGELDQPMLDRLDQ